MSMRKTINSRIILLPSREPESIKIFVGRLTWTVCRVWSMLYGIANENRSGRLIVCSYQQYKKTNVGVCNFTSNELFTPSQKFTVTFIKSMDLKKFFMFIVIYQACLFPVKRQASKQYMFITVNVWEKLSPHGVDGKSIRWT